MEEVKKIYIDSNLLIDAAVDEGRYGEQARGVLFALQKGKIIGYTSVFTLDEVYYKILRLKSRKQAQAFCEAILEDASIRFVDASRKILSNSMQILRDSAFLPRDAIHLATMNSLGIKVIYSNDGDFDSVKGIKRVGGSNL